MTCLREQIKHKSDEEVSADSDKNDGVPAWLVGLVERFFFTVAVAYNLSGVIIGMIGWITVKMATNWNREGLDNHPSMALSGLLGGLMSMIFSLLGGLVWKGVIWF